MRAFFLAWLWISCLGIGTGAVVWAVEPAPPGPFLPLFQDRALFDQALENLSGTPLTEPVTGATVPHHLLAVDLIADTFGLLSGQGYERVVILTTDHFHRGTTVVSTTTRDYQTVFGPLETDRDFTRSLLVHPWISESNLFSHEHGVQALVPFVARFFPRARVVSLSLDIKADLKVWQDLSQALVALLRNTGQKTLVLQSTDYSHYLPMDEAAVKDQQSLRVIASSSLKLVSRLGEPDHLDSKAAQYVQMRVQREAFGARPLVVANRNSQEYVLEDLQETTSYVVQVYSPEALPPVALEYSYLFAGDTFLGRFMAEKLKRPGRFQALVEAVLKKTRGARLIVNLEGPIMEKCPPRPGPLELCMERGPSLPLLEALNVTAVSLANNHIHDFGPAAYEGTKRILEEAGIRYVENGSFLEFPEFRLAAFTDLDNQGPEGSRTVKLEDLDRLGQVDRDRPIFVFIHWGAEYSAWPSRRERNLAEALYAKGVELVVGAHSHVASDLACDLDACTMYSLGNFLFDRLAPPVSGKLLEITFFPQGTHSLRTLEIGNLYQDF